MFQIVMDAEKKDMELTLNEFQEWYDKKESKTAKSKVSYFLVINFVWLL